MVEEEELHTPTAALETALATVRAGTLSAIFSGADPYVALRPARRSIQASQRVFVVCAPRFNGGVLERGCLGGDARPVHKGQTVRHAPDHARTETAREHFAFSQTGDLADNLIQVRLGIALPVHVVHSAVGRGRSSLASWSASTAVGKGDCQRRGWFTTPI